MKSIPLKLFVLALLLISSACSKSNKSTKPPDVDYYTCTMHPSVHAEAPGKCPICGMDLVPVMKKKRFAIRAVERRRYARHGRNAGDAKWQANERRVVARIRRPGRAAAANRRHLCNRDTGTDRKST